MKRYVLLLLVGQIILISCKKEKQHSCSDGIFSVEYELQTDCGKTCPPCNNSSKDTSTLIFAQINGVPQTFTKYTLTKNAYWIFYFHTDSTYITINFGNNSAVGNHPLLSSFSEATHKYTSYTSLENGIVAFDSVNHQQKWMNGIFQATFVSSLNDTLRITGGEFKRIYW